MSTNPLKNGQTVRPDYSHETPAERLARWNLSCVRDDIEWYYATPTELKLRPKR